MTPAASGAPAADPPAVDPPPAAEAFIVPLSETPDLVKIATDGSSLAFTETSWDCVYDNSTGLTWAIWDFNNTYTWYDSSLSGHWQEEAVGTESVLDTEDAVANAVAANHCGIADWRLPKTQEFSTIWVPESTPDIAADPDFFPELVGTATPEENFFWTADSHANIGFAKMFSLAWEGGVGTASKVSTLGTFRPLKVMLVSGATSNSTDDVVQKNTPNGYAEQMWEPILISSTPTARFTDNADGTVTDKATGLQWMRCRLGANWDGTTCVTDANANATSVADYGILVADGDFATRYSWDDGIIAASDLNAAGGYAGMNDWRYPTVKEALTIVETQTAYPPVNQAIFTDEPGWDMWTSTEDSGSPTIYARTLGVSGTTGNGFKDGMVDHPHVRLVRVAF